MEEQVDKKGFLETTKGKIIIGVVAGVVLVATIIVIVAVKLSGGKDEGKDEVANQQQGQTGESNQTPKLSDSDLANLSQDSFDKLVSGEVKIKRAVPAYTGALNKLLKVKDLPLDVFKKLVASPPLVDEAGKV